MTLSRDTLEGLVLYILVKSFVEMAKYLLSQPQDFPQKLYDVLK